MPSPDLAIDIALIIGGGTGIGLGIARSLIEAGTRVVLSSRKEDALREATRELGPQATYRVHDMTDFDRSESLVTEVEETVGPISILINNAGNHLKKPSEEVSTDEFKAILDVHVLGAHHLTVAVGKRMMLRGRGSVVFIASMTSLLGIPGVVAYSAAKAGYLGIVRTLATEWGPKGIRVNAIAPGWIESDMMHEALESDPERRQTILSRTPLGGFGEAEDSRAVRRTPCRTSGRPAPAARSSTAATGLSARDVPASDRSGAQWEQRAGVLPGHSCRNDRGRHL